jgi:hypothetical protein
MDMESINLQMEIFMKDVSVEMRPKAREGIPTIKETQLKAFFN